MRFPSPLIKATLERRYKRFLADVILSDGITETIHCPNPGAMAGLAEPGATVWLSRSPNAKRKLPLTWELTETDHGLVGINTANPNRIVREALEARQIAPLSAYSHVRPEVNYGRASRVDFLLEEDRLPPCFVEVKNVHFFREAELAEFPDCVTARGTRHLEDLSAVAQNGARAVMLYLVQRDHAAGFKIASDVDPAYGAGLIAARRNGVEVLVYTSSLTLEGIALKDPIPYI